MTAAPYWPKRAQDRRGMTARNTSPLMTSDGDLPANTTLMVLDVSGDGAHADVSRYELVGAPIKGVSMSKLKPTLPPHEQQPTRRGN